MTIRKHTAVATRSGIDWDAVRQRLRQSEQALERTWAVDEERIQRIFHERARQLAARRAEEDESAETFQLLVFCLEPERYGLDLRCVTQIVPYRGCTPVPESPPQLLGVTNLRGEIRSVVDLRAVLELPQASCDTGGYLVVVRHQGQQVGFRVDQIDNIHRTRSDTLTAAGECPMELSAKYMGGMTPERIIVLDTAAIFAHPVF